MTKIKVTCANRTVLSKLDCLDENHTSELLEIKEAITKSHEIVQEKHQELAKVKGTCTTAGGWSPEYRKNIADAKKVLEDTCHPGYVIAFDNYIDVQLQRKNMTIASQNYRNYHWVNQKMITNRVSGCKLPSGSPKADVLEVPNIRFFFPSYEEHQQQHIEYSILVSRILVDHFEAFKTLKNICIQHIPHKHTKEMSQKSSKVCTNIFSKHKEITIGSLFNHCAYNCIFSQSLLLPKKENWLNIQSFLVFFLFIHLNNSVSTCNFPQSLHIFLSCCFLFRI